MIRAVVIWLAAAALGAFLVAVLPERWLGGGVLFRLGDRHGPSPADSVGLAVVLSGQLVYLHALWSRRRWLQPRWVAYSLAVAAVAAMAGCLAAFAANQDGWAYALAGAAFAAPLALGLTTRNG